MNKKAIFFVLIGFLAMTPATTFSKPSDKIDGELLTLIRSKSPSDPISILLVFQDIPLEEQLNTLQTAHKMKITYVYTIINGIAGIAPAGEIIEIAEYSWIEAIWPDRKMYTDSTTLETSKLLNELQTKNDELRQTITNLTQEVSELQQKTEDQQMHISKLETNLRTYSAGMFIIGFITGIILIIFVQKRS